MVRFALFGAGRIGRLHAANVAANPRAVLHRVFDVYPPAAESVAKAHGVPVAEDVASIMSDDRVDAVLIASTTETHIELMLAAAEAGKAVFCEKPIDLDIARVDRNAGRLAATGVPIQIGFNRRFDPTHRAVHAAVQQGQVGDVEQITLISRDPGLPPLSYLESSGGLFRDMMIHDFDMARFIAREEFTTVSALGTALVDAQVAEIGDVDSAVVIMSTDSGMQCQITCSRRAVYGYDQRVEVFGSRGMVQSANPPTNHIVRHGAEFTDARAALHDFFVERYPAAYQSELDAFITVVEEGGQPTVTCEDGRRALILANAADEAWRTGSVISVTYS